jgi:PLP dependent protein
MSIAANISEFRKKLPASCTLIAVSKTQPVERLEEAYVAGQRVFGENKVQEIAPKYEALPKDIQWHMIGHLQSNKVKYIAPFVSLIHSVDSVKLLQEINRQAEKNSRVISCLLQVHIAKEETKFGFSESEITDLLDSDIKETLKNVNVIGLMGMATFTDNKDHVRSEFKGLKSLFDKLRSRSLPDNFSMQELSMGMSGDYEVALEEGSTMIRVGTAIFGNRNYSTQS